MPQYDAIDRALDEENPGPMDLESVLVHETLADVRRKPALVLDPKASLADALRLMREQRKGCVLIVRQGKLAGIFTERDVLMKIAGNKIDLERTPVTAHMTRDPATLPVDAGVAFALNKMIVEGFRHIPLVDDKGKIVGVLSMRDIIEYLSDFFRRDILTLPPDPRVAAQKRHGA